MRPACQPIIVYFVLVFCSAASYASVLRVPTVYSSIQAAVNSSQDGDTVLLAHGTYYEQVSIFERRLTLAGGYLFSHDTLERDQTIITIPDSVRFASGDRKSIIIVDRSTGFRLVGTTLRDGLGTRYFINAGFNLIWGGCLFADTTVLQMEGCRVVNGYAAKGGGVGIWKGKLSLIDCEFDTNNSVGNSAEGGGLYAGVDSVTILRGRFFYNNCEYSDGGISLQVYQAGTIDSCMIIENSAVSYNGAVVCAGSVSFHGNYIIGNRAAGDAGVLISTQTWGQGGEFTGNIVRNNVNNVDSINGSEVGCEILTTTFSHWTISDNVFDGNINQGLGGGAMALQNGIFTIHHNVFSNNTSGGGTAAIYIAQIAHVTIDSNVFYNNSGGTAVYSMMGYVTMHNNDFYGNTPNAVRYQDGNPPSTWVADHNYWGDPSGPRATNNPGGHGDSVDYRIPYTPWLTSSLFPTSVRENLNSTPLPNHYKIVRISPNPFNSTTVITYQLPHATNVDLSLFDLDGHHIKTPIHGELSAGTHSTSFDGSHLASGTYFIRLNVNGFSESKKLVLLR